MNYFESAIVVLISAQLLHSISLGVCWRAVPANQAMYALRSRDVGTHTEKEVPDNMLPRDQLNFVYKFGYCRSDVISSHLLRKSVNVTPSIANWQRHKSDFIYLIEHKHTRRYAQQCVVMKAYVNRKFLFFKSRLPLYYCQGTLLILLERTVNRFAVHEMYLHQKLPVPMNFVFEFYHPPPL